MKYLLAILIGLSVLTPLTFFLPSNNNVALVNVDSSKYQCNRYADPKSNFEVLSILPIGTDNSNGQFLSDNIDSIKAWLTTRWSFPNEPFSVKCKIVLVPTKEIFSELFNKESPQYRVVRDGQLKEISIWISTDNPRWHTDVLTKVLTDISLKELENAHGSIGFWIYRGMPIMNSSYANIRQNLGNLSLVFEKDLQVYWSKEILNMTPEIFAKQPQTSAVWFDSQSACFMLMLYKEFGSQKFDLFLSQYHIGGAEAALKTAYGYNSYAECDLAFRSYMQNLSRDLIGRGERITPNSYLNWPIP